MGGITNWMIEVLYQPPILILGGVKLLASQGCSLVEQRGHLLIYIYNSGVQLTLLPRVTLSNE